MGINISEIVQGEKWRNFMKYLYAWGASLVLLGALFKLMYWPGAGTMLTIGMTTEVVIFFFSAFEPLHDEPDWTLVYPELAGMSDEEELRKYRKGTGLEGVNAEDLKEIISSVMAATAGGAAPQISAGYEGKVAPVYASSGSGGIVFSEKFNEMLEKAEIGPELFEKISKGLNKLSDTTTKLSDITEAASATTLYAENMKKASQSIEGFVDSYQGSGQVLNESVNILSESFQKVAGTISESGQNFKGSVERSVGSLESQLSNAGKEVHDRLVQSGNDVASQMGSSATGLTTMYSQLAEAMKANGEIISSSSSEYHVQLDRLNKNMAALNAAHELHLQGTAEKLKESQQVYAGVESMMKKLNTSIEETEKYADSVAKLNENIASLNKVYGNMLSAMNVMSNNA
ncbi:MAG: gliding motility protein GldL [Bacteroidales bacterium]|nr:gliding motility protein GldL [Bacteroidales bacterium]